MSYETFQILEKINNAKVDVLFDSWDWSKGCPPLPKEDLNSLGMQLFNAQMMDNKDDVKVIKREIKAYKREHNIGLINRLFRKTA